ncbi:Ricin B-type lectin domain-containing protein [Durusdinium trenchii]
MAHVQQVHFIVLANWNYPGGNNLAYVMQNDVRLMEAALRRKFLNALAVHNGDLVIIYVGGHGVTAGGGSVSVLLPIDFQRDQPHPELWAPHARLKTILAVFQQYNQDGLNHVIWNICREPAQNLTLSHMEIPGYNYFIMFACADSRVSYVGNNMADVNGDGQPYVQVSNLPKAYDEALQPSPDLRSLSDSVRARASGMRQPPATPQIVQAVDTLMPPEGGTFGFWGPIASWMWSNVVRPVAHAGLDAAQHVANNVVQQGHRAVDAFAFAPAPPAAPPAWGALQDGLYIIRARGGANERRILCCADDGERVDLWHEVDRSGRQVWRVTSAGRFFTVEVLAGTGERRYLSCHEDGETVDLWTHDDASGRQRWTLQRNLNGSWKIQIVEGVNGDRKYLNCTHDGKKCDLWHVDDESGRQHWILEPAR